MADKTTLADHAEAWWREQGKRVPRRNTNTWERMYVRWIEFAFADFRETVSG
jgi:hypothetical protein